MRENKENRISRNTPASAPGAADTLYDPLFFKCNSQMTFIPKREPFIYQYFNSKLVAG
jgi:hypothetical protein